MMPFERKTRKLWSLRFVTIVITISAVSSWAFAQIIVTEEPVGKTLPDDPMQSVNATDLAPAGWLLYQASVRVPGERIRQRYLVVRSTGQGKGKGLVYRVKVPDGVPATVFDPQFSPDGTRILFKAGWPYEELSTYRVYLWNLTTRKLESGPPEELTYRRIALSPDGRYLAYSRGGNAQGDERGPDRTAPLDLFVYDFNSKTSRVIVRNPAVKYVAWRDADTLLYSTIDRQGWGDDTSQKRVRPTLYEVSVTGAPKLVLEDSYKPAPSPDGRWIACFTSSDPAKNISPTNQFHLDLPRQAYLCLYDRLEGKRFVVRPVRDSYPELLWTPNSKRLVVIQRTYNKTQGQANISTVAVPALEEKVLATVSANDAIPVSWDQLEPQFQPLTVTKDGQFLILRVSESKGRGENETFMNEMKSVLAVNLQNGAATPIAQIYNWQSSSLGLDWQDNTALHGLAELG